LNTRNLRHWAVLLIIILGIGGVVFGMHQIDQQDKHEVATSNHLHAKQTHDTLAKDAAASKQHRDRTKTVSAFYLLAKSIKR